MRKSIQESGINVGDTIGVLTRPADDCILLFGYGSYIGDTVINGDLWPTVALNDKEMVLARPQIAVGTQKWIDAMCKDFEGDVHTADIEKWLAGGYTVQRKDAELPKPKEGSPEAPTEPPRPLTVFDHVQALAAKRKAVEERREAAAAVVVECEEELVMIQEQAQELRVQAHQEIDALAEESST